MSITKKQSRFTLVHLLIAAVIFTSCSKKKSDVGYNKQEGPELNSSPDVDVSLIVNMSNVTYELLDKNELMQELSDNNRIKNFSTVIEKNQIGILKMVTKIADEKLIIIKHLKTSVSNLQKEDTLNINYSKRYFNVVENGLKEQMDVLKSILKKSKDDKLLKFAKMQLKQQEEILKITQSFEKRFIQIE